jgi:hypothetical protein
LKPKLKQKSTFCDNINKAINNISAKWAGFLRDQPALKESCTKNDEKNAKNWVPEIYGEEPIFNTLANL